MKKSGLLTFLLMLTVICGHAQEALNDDGSIDGPFLVKKTVLDRPVGETMGLYTADGKTLVRILSYSGCVCVSPETTCILPNAFNYARSADDRGLAVYVAKTTNLTKLYTTSFNGVYQVYFVGDNQTISDVSPTTDNVSSQQIQDESNAQEVARYNIEGQKLSTPQSGINIVKMSDHTAKKVWVKE